MDRDSSRGKDLAFQFELLIDIANGHHEAVQKTSVKNKEALRDLDKLFRQQTVEGFVDILKEKGALQSFVMFINTEGVHIYVTTRDPEIPTQKTTMHLDECRDLFLRYKPYMIVDMFSLDFLVPDISRSLIRFVMTNLYTEEVESSLIEFQLSDGNAAVLRQIPVKVDESDNVLSKDFAQ
jgi:hypothetical protein